MYNVSIKNVAAKSSVWKKYFIFYSYEDEEVEIYVEIGKYVAKKWELCYLKNT